MNDRPLDSSFRDPSGFLYRHDGRLLRQVNEVYLPHLRLLEESGLYELLVGESLLIPHRHETLELALTSDGAAVLEPELVPFISYPYEWSFSQLKDAALATLRIQRLALSKGLSLKDASAYNIQFHRGRPVLIDSLSFEPYVEGEPWIAYRQFCQHFLAPLALMSYRDIRLGSLMRSHIDGVPLDLAVRLLPWRAQLRPGLLMHLFLHAGSQRKHAGDGAPAKKRAVSRNALTGILDSLRGAIRKLEFKTGGTEWGDYYTATNYTDEALQRKRALVGEYLDRCDDGMVWDLGANNGYFSRLASERGRPTVAFDIDPVAVEHNWLACRRGAEEHLLPLQLDLTNPSPSLGWAHAERDSLLARGPAETVIALALIHHLAISNNVPLRRLAEFFHAAGHRLVIEFVPKSDSQVQRLLATREDVFPNYTLDGFAEAFAGGFETLARTPIEGTERVLFLMKRKGEAAPADPTRQEQR